LAPLCSATSHRAVLYIFWFIALNDEMIVRSLQSGWEDIEDDMQLECAHSIRNRDGIVTRNIKDFKGAKVPVLGPERVLAF
jgi:hypothetical protein